MHGTFFICFSILEFKPGTGVSMAMKMTVEQDHSGMGRNLVQTKFMAEIGQTWFMKLPKTVDKSK